MGVSGGGGGGTGLRLLYNAIENLCDPLGISP